MTATFPTAPPEAIAIWLTDGQIHLTTRAGEHIIIPERERERLFAVIAGTAQAQLRTDAVFAARRELREAEWNAARARKMAELRAKEEERQQVERTRVLSRDAKNEKRKEHLALAKLLGI